MDSVILTLSKYGTYSDLNGSNAEMEILGYFFSSDVRCSDNESPTFREWALDDSLGMGVGGNMCFLEKEGDYIYLTDAYSEKAVPTEVKMTRQQLAQLLDEWQDKICKYKPKEVIIKHDNNDFFIETKN